MTNIFPSNVTAGSQGFTMFVTGSGFHSGLQGVTFAYWNGSARSTALNAQTGELAVVHSAVRRGRREHRHDHCRESAARRIVRAAGGNCGPNNTFTIVMPQPGDPGSIASFNPRQAPNREVRCLHTDGERLKICGGDMVVLNGSQRRGDIS